MNFLKIIFIFFFFLIFNTNHLTADIIKKGNKTINKITNQSKTVLKSLTRTSLKDKEIKKFLSENVITIDDERGDGLVTYYFDKKIYKRYKNLILISEDKWKVSYLDKKLKIYYGKDKNTWKIQPGEKNFISINKKITTMGKSYKFSYENKTDYYLKLEEEKLPK